ncbi:MAG: 1,4-dihydroxy-2-naphthoate octaprenyltransferase [Bacteroidales bacterium]|nr:1,4-dihydroxy-2-naphthoate octaprenyltransferase [Bacteroidales bacterium]
MKGERCKSWVRAARPRTVLLSLSGVMLGGFLAAATGFFYPVAVVLAAVTAMLLQILSNLANDYGDFKKGLDNPDRVGPQRVMQSGELTEKQMRIGIVVVGILALLSGGALLLLAWSYFSWKELVVFAILGIAAIAAALFYTLGKHPYGYRGLGDLLCFLFFGWVAVAGTFYLAANRFDPLVLLPATAMGLLSVAVLNINNMRDYAHDKANGKNTLVVKLGLKNAFVYHIVLIVGTFVCLTAFLWLKHVSWYAYGFWIMFPFFLMDLLTIRKTLHTGVPDRLLPKQVVQSFLLIFLFVFSYFML